MSGRLVPYLLSLLVLASLTSVGAADETWSIYAHAPVPNEDMEVLREVFLATSLETRTAPSPTTVEWAWYSWSETSGSSWPKDDALYRQEHFGLNQSETEEHVVEHPRSPNNLMTVTGKVNVVAAEDYVRFVTFELSLTPTVNLSNQTLMYLVLTEDKAVDNHQRSTTNLVRELRPEVAFSLRANNTTEMTAMLSGEHLIAAGVDLIDQPTGWSYSIAVFGGLEEAEELELLVLKSDRLPSPSRHLTPTQAWLPVILTGLAVVLMWSIVSASRTREQSIPLLQANWSEHDEGVVHLSITAGKAGFRITHWHIQAPWMFKGRPPRKTFTPEEQVELTIAFKQVHDEECHIEASIEVEGFGAWRQHVWLESPKNSDADVDHRNQEE